MDDRSRSSPIRVAVSGSGFMGHEILAALCREPNFEPIGVIEKFSDEDSFTLPDGSGQIPMSTDPDALLSKIQPQVVIDFSNADWTPRVARAALNAGARLVIGTS